MWQTVDHLKQMLETINVTYIERMFETESGATGLGPQLFVSSLKEHSGLVTSDLLTWISYT